MERLDVLYDLCDRLMDELTEITEMVIQGDITKECLDEIDKLTHSIKSLKTTIAMIEAEDSGWSYEGGNEGASGRGRSYRSYNNGSYRMSRRGNSRARYTRAGSHTVHDENSQG